MPRAKVISACGIALLVAFAVFGVISYGDLVESDSGGKAMNPLGSASRWKDRLAAQAQSQPMLKGESHATYFAALKHRQPVPTGSRQRMRVSLGSQESQLGIRLRRGYFLSTNIGTGIWVMMGHRVVCIFNGRSFAVACDTAYNTAKYGLVSVSGPSPAAFKNPPVEAVGIAPNGIRGVQLGVLGRPDHLVPVIKNTFGLRTHRPIQVKGVIR